MFDDNNANISISSLCETLHITKEETYSILAFNSKELFAEFPDVVTVDDSDGRNNNCTIS